MSSTELTTSQLLSAAEEALSAGEYRAVGLPDGWSKLRSRLYEDSYGIVAVFAFETWADLFALWPAAQGLLVDVMTAHLDADTPKAWEGYLILLTPGRPALAEREDLMSIRYDTHRVRKLVATGDDLATLDDVREALRPVLPLTTDLPAAAGEPVLDRLPEILAESGVDLTLARAAVDAFAMNDSILDRLHQLDQGDSHEAR